MIIAGNIVSALGLILNLIGCGYWVWYGFAFQENRFAVIRSKSPWHLLGNLAVIGIVIFAAGRAMAGSH
jgi:hypothetical protein